MRKWILKVIGAPSWTVCYDGEEGKSSTDGEANKNQSQNDEDKPTISQKKLNDLLAAERKKGNEEKQKVIDQLEQLKKAKGLSDEERKQLQTQIEEHKNSMLTKEELAAKERKALESRHKSELEAATARGDKFWNLYQKSVFDTEITSAAVKHDAFRPNQIINVLGPLTSMVEDRDDNGNPTGTYTPRVKFPTMKDGKRIELDLSVEAAVKHMKDTPDEWGNYFKSGVVSGLGGSSGSGSSGGSGDSSKPPTDPAKYRAWREKNKEKLK